MTIFNKIKWIAGILLVFFIVLMTNLIDKDNYKKLSQSVTTIYEDRIVASDLLFEMSMLIQEKQVALIKEDSLLFKANNGRITEDLNNHIVIYEETRLTKNEQFILDRFKKSLSRLEHQEKQFFRGEAEDASLALESVEIIREQLHELSDIQLQESRRQVFVSDQAMDSIHFFTQWEIIILVVMALIFQVIVLLQRRKKE